MVTKVTAVNIQDKVTTGDKAATLINDNKRAINQVIDAKEESLGNPVNSGRLLSSTADGVRKWVDVGRSRTFQSVVDAVNYVTVNPNTLDQVTTVSYRNKVECTSLGVDYPDGNGGEYTVVEGESLLAGLVIAAGTKQLKLITQKLDLPIENVTALREFEPTVDGQECTLSGHTVKGIGGGKFYAILNDVGGVDNNGTKFMTAGGHSWNRKKSGYPPTVLDFGALGKGAGFPDSAAFQNAANNGDFHIPSCDQYYLVGGLSIPAGTTVTGEKIYTYTAFNVSNIVGKNAVVYDVSDPTFISWGNNCSIINCSFHGVDRSRKFLDTSSGSNIRMFRCDVFRFSVGFGDNNGIGNCRVLESHFSGNTNGIRGLVDSHVYMCEINANEESGVVIATGHNDTNYIGNKVEWNNGKGFEVFSGNASNIIIGGVIDRNGEAGVSVTSDAGLLISTVKFRRNGRLSEGTTEQDCHISIRGDVSKKLRISNIQTAAGGDDGGGSYISPKYTIVAANGGNIIGSLSDSDLTGATSHVFRRVSGGTLTVGNFSDNNVTGLELFDAGSVVFSSGSGNEGYKFFGEGYSSIKTEVYSGATLDVTFSSLPTIGTYSKKSYLVDILTRNAASGNTGSQRYLLVCTREGGAANDVLLEIFSTAGNNPLVSAGFNPDGSILTLTLDPQSASLQSTLAISKVVDF